MGKYNSEERLFREANKGKPCGKRGGCQHHGVGEELHHMKRPRTVDRRRKQNLQMLCRSCHVEGHRFTTRHKFPPDLELDDVYAI